MKELENKKKTTIHIKKDYIIFLVIFLLAVIMYINWINMHYSADTYNIINVGYEKYATNWSLKDGRLIMYFITMIFAKLHIPIEVYVISTLLVALVISCICVIKLKNIIINCSNRENTKTKEIFVTIASFFTIFNFMYIEDMYFVESIVMALSLLLFTYSANIIVNNKKLKNRIIALILAIIGIIAYQGTAGFLIILTFVISLLTNKVELRGNKDKIKTNIRQIFLDTVMAGIITAIAIVINMILVKVIGNITGQVQTRVGSIFAIFENLKYIISNFNVILKENIGLFPTNLLYIFIGITLILALIYDLKTKSVNFLTIKLMCIIIISVVCGFLVSLGTLSSFYTGRLHYCIGTMMGFVLICLIMENEDEIFRRIIELILIMYSIVNIYNCIIVTYEHKLVNEYEKQSAKEIEEYIEKYEKENKKQVENIAIYTITGQNYKTYFKEINRKSVVTYNALRCNWSADGVINFYTDRELNTVNLNKELLQEYLKVGKDNGYGIINNTLIVECYMY